MLNETFLFIQLLPNHEDNLGPIHPNKENDLFFKFSCVQAEKKKHFFWEVGPKF